MKQTFLISILLGCYAASFCQSGKLTGSVMEEATKTPLELATVSVFGPDSSLITYQLSDKSGKFTIEKLPLKKKLLINVTYTGYTVFNKNIQFDKDGTDTLSVFLALNNNSTDAVVVTTTIPIRMNGDTLEINPAAFKMKSDAVVEELLNQISGIVIWSDGTITVNGKKVQNLLVEGKPFMGSNDSRVATQNLPKEAIDKIQLYQEYDRSRIGQPKTQEDSVLTMNIKLKEHSKKGYFGKAGAGYGTNDRFESDLSLQMYTKNSSVGIGGGFNNINKSIGNLQEMFQNNTYRNYNPNLYNVGRFGTNGINKNHSIGAVYTHSFIESSNSRQNNRIVVNYNKSGTDMFLTNLSLQNRTTLYNPQVIRNEGTQTMQQDRHEFSFNYVKTNSYNDNFNLNGSANRNEENNKSRGYTEVRDSANQLQSTNDAITVQNRKSDNESMTLTFAKSNAEDPLKNFSIQLNTGRNYSESDRNVRSTFVSFTDMSKSNSKNREYNVDNQSVNLNATLDYLGFKRFLLGRYNLFGINLTLSQVLGYNRSKDNSGVSDYDSVLKRYIVNDDLSNFNTKEAFQYTPSLVMEKMFYKYSDVKYRSINVRGKLLNDIKSEKNQSSIERRNLDRSFQFLRYEGNVGYNYQIREKYYYYASLNYIKNYEYPSIDQLFPIVDDINAYDIRVGSSQLQNRTNHTVNLSAYFNTLNPKAIYSINSNISGNFTHSLNAITDSLINDRSGKRISYYINADKSNNLGLNYTFNISRNLKKNKIQLMYSGQVSNRQLPNYVDGVSNVSETHNISNQFNLQFSLKSIMVLTIEERLQRNKTKQTAKGLLSFKNDNNTTRFGIVFNYPKNVTLSSTMDRIVNSNLSEPTLLWNAFTTYRFMKQQGELKFSAMDLLRQYQNISNSADSYGTSTRISNGLQQYFLLTFSYYPRKFGKTQIKKPS